MKKIRFVLSVWVCKILIYLGKLMGKKGSATPGAIAYKICPDVLRILSVKISKGIIAVCGTNGKTTTNNIIDKILTDKGFKVVCNNIGANMLSGVITAFIEKCDLKGNINYDYATLEMDEAFAVKIFEHLTPTVMVITNLFRDQLDRYGEVELTANYLKGALNLKKEVKLIVNGDDPVLFNIAKEHGNYLTFGVGQKSVSSYKDGEMKLCPRCSKKLSYEYYHYSHLGNFSCDNCGFNHPDLDFYAKDIDLSDGISFAVNDDTKIALNYKGFYNVYNVLAALSVIKTLGIDFENINEVLSDYKPQVARMEAFNLKKKVILNLAKNPAGFNQALQTVMSDKAKKDIILAINDCESDGRDISWIWDVDFDFLKNQNVGSIGLCGMRKDELNVRLKYSEVNALYNTYDNIKEAILDKLETDSDVLYVLVNYTVIFESQKILKELEGKNNG
ncbi:MAG: DUF1727 domain-containing protein [Ruminococcaceae bacterium]|nr:DUF1727 domain-containing protein [Oscillospiraceae bacterium]